MLPEIYLGSQDDLTQEELDMIRETSHRVLLDTAFSDLSSELSSDGNTDRLRHLREKHARLILSYWRMVKDHYSQAQEEGRISKETGDELVEGDERITVMQLGVYESDDEQVLTIHRKAPFEKDEVRITALEDRGIDDFMYPPTIKSEYLDPNEREDVNFELIIRSGLISTFSRAIIHSAPDHSRQYVKDIKTIDFSSFGVDLAR